MKFGRGGGSRGVGAGFTGWRSSHGRGSRRDARGGVGRRAAVFKVGAAAEEADAGAGKGAEAGDWVGEKQAQDQLVV